MAPVKGMFRSLRIYNYRVWALGGLVSNIGTWMQRIAQDWLVLTQLTHNSATAVGIVTALQFGPMLVLLPLTGYAADHLNRRRLLIATQVAMGLLALGLGLLTVTGKVQLWEVYVFALLVGCVGAFDAPARQSFVSDVVGDEDLANAVALNSTSFNAARLIGPAIAGGLIAAVGTGWAFLINAASFLAVLGSFAVMRLHELHPGHHAAHRRAGLMEGFRYVAKRPDIQVVLLMLAVIGTFGINFAIFISTMSVTVFHAGASRYGFLTSMMAIGSVSGALIGARLANPGIGLLCRAAAVFGLGLALAAMMPNYWLFGLALIVVGTSIQVFVVAANSALQLSTDAGMRGRVMALFFAVAVGGTPLGAPVVGWVADGFGARWGVAVGAASGFVGTLVALRYLATRSDGRTLTH